MNIVFDFGAVLFGWQPEKLLARHFPQLTQKPADVRQLVRAVFHHESWQRFDKGTVELAAVVSETAARLTLPAPALHALMAPIGEELEPIACIVDLLGQLRCRREQAGDIRLYYLSNMPAPFARVLEQKHEFINWFDGGIFSGDVKLGKPDPAIYELLATRHALAPEATLFIDDTAVNVQAARDRGWQAIHCQQPEALAAQLQTVLKGYR
ncbi:MAG: HAD family phosphatase [Rhodoferax sp.]|nr:HAD family phosphatase [Rhodoferax sp.]